MDRYAEIPLDRRKETADRRKEQGEHGEESLRIRDIYESVFSDIEAGLPRIREDMEESIQFASERFSDLPEAEREELQRFSLICRLSAEVYMRKIFIEKLLDAGNFPDKK